MLANDLPFTAITVAVLVLAGIQTIFIAALKTYKGGELLMVKGCKHFIQIQ